MKPSNEPLRRVSSRNSKHLSIIKNPRDRYTPPFPDKILLRGSLEETRQWIYIYISRYIGLLVRIKISRTEERRNLLERCIGTRGMLLNH